LEGYLAYLEGTLAVESCLGEYSLGSFANLTHLDARMALEAGFEDHFLLERHLDSFEERGAWGDTGICLVAPFAFLD